MSAELTRLPFFVYGTLRHGLSNYQKHLCGRTAAEESSRLSGYILYDAGGFPFAVRKPGDTNSVVVGELMIIRSDQYDGVLRQLDELEGYDPADPTCLYKRVTATVCSEAGPISAWLYEAGDTVERDFGSDDKIHCGDWVLHQNGIRAAPEK